MSREIRDYSIFGKNTPRQIHEIKNRSICISIGGEIDGYYVAYKPITIPCISFMFIEIKFIHYHSYVMFAMKSINICND